jgi:hypothetical protein
MQSKREKRDIRNKKGEITIAWIITIVLLAFGFILLLIFLYNMYGSADINREVCHESVIFRATVPQIAQSYLPLKCSTRKICITAGLFNSGSCDDEFKGEKNLIKAKVSSPKDIEKLYSQEILECWKMMGEGKLSLFTQYFTKNFGIGEDVYPSCILCSRIAYDKESLNKAGIDLSAVNVPFYMQHYKVPNSELTYFETLNINSNDAAVPFDGLKQGEIESGTGKIKVDEKTNNAETTALQGDLVKSITSNSEELLQTDAIMFMQISAPTQGGSLANIGKLSLIGLGGSFFAAPILTGRFVVGALSNWEITLPLAIIGVGLQQLNVAHNRDITAGYCGNLTLSSGQARSGCTAVRTVSYNATAISQYCINIESIP